MLKFKNITKTFKSELISKKFTALNDVSFTIPTGSMVGFLGANGAGKTTSLKIIMNFIRPDNGSVEFASELGRNQREIFRHVGFLPERPYFYQNLKGHEFLDFMGKLSGMNSDEIHKGKTKWAERFNIHHALDRTLKNYSKGMLQRIGFLATIIHDPQFIILDEPLSGLDPIGRKELKDVIKQVHDEGKTVFFSTHIVSDIEEICDRVIFLKEGNLIYDGGLDKLMATGGSKTYEIKIKSDKVPPTSLPYSNLVKLPDQLQVLTVEEAHRQEMLKQFLNQGIEVTGLEVIKPSLEQIFYNIRS